MLFSRSVKYLVFGCLMGLIFFFEPSLIFLSFLILTLVLFIQTRPEEEKKDLVKIVAVASVMRLIFFAVAISYLYFSYINIPHNPVTAKIVGHSIQAVRDFEREVTNGKLIARYLKGEFGNVPINDIAFGGHYYLHFGAYFQGWLNYLFGISIFNLASFPVLGLWVIILSYYLAKEVFDKRVAVFTSLIIALLPSFNIWSCTNIRTTFGIFGILLMAYCLTLFFKKNHIRFILPLFVSIFIFSTVKDRFLRPAFMVIALVLFLSLNIRARFKVISLILACAIMLNFPVINVTFKGILEDIISSQLGFISAGGGSTYKIYSDAAFSLPPANEVSLTSLAAILIQGLPKGLFYFLFSPFPTKVSNNLRMFAYPQMIFWYFMFIFAMFGIVKAVLSRNSKVLPVIYVCSFFVVLFSLVLGNEGIAARFRDMVSPFFYMLAGSVLCGWFLPSRKARD